jgi:integrase
MRLTWDDVDFERATVRTYSYKGSKRRERWIPLNQTARAALKSVKVHMDSPYVFPQKDGRMWRWPKSFYTHWDKIVAESGVKDFYFHDTRHTFASRLAMKGEHIENISKWLGHSTLKMTERYRHLSPKRQAEGVALLDQHYVGVAGKAGCSLGVVGALDANKNESLRIKSSYNFGSN